MRNSTTWIAASLVVGVAGCSSDSELGSVYIKSGTVSALIGGSLTVTQTDCIQDSAKCPFVGTSIVIPRGALAEDKMITIAPGEDATDRDGEVIGPALDFGPDGTSFSSPVEITIPLAKEIEKDLLRVYVTQKDGSKSVLMPYQLAYDRQAKQVRFLVNHFTTFQCGEGHDDCSDVNNCPDGTCSNGQCNTDCDPSECGPQPGAPSWTCDDGTTGGFTGQCVRQPDGSCGWDINLCPEECTADECGPAPGAPNIQCPDGTVGGPVCRRAADGGCGWDFVDCPVPCDNGQTCAPGDVCSPNGGCVPATCDAAGVSCPDGTVCDPATGTCNPIACTDANGQTCPPGSTCDPNTGACNPACICPDNQPCAISSDGSVHCGCTDPSDPNCNPNTCNNGQTCPPGSVCDAATGTCIDECVCPDGQSCVMTDPNTGVSCQNDECDATTECGPAPGVPSWTCEDGTQGGSTGRCLRNSDGTCGWEIIWCAQACSETECGAPPPTDPNNACADGTIPPYVCRHDENGVCTWQQSCGPNGGN